MPDASRFPFPSDTAGGAATPNAVRVGSVHAPSRGLPLLSTAPLTAREREALRDLARAQRVLADRIDEALGLNRVDLGLEACTRAAELGTAAARAAAVLGSGR